jgi:hypothetical protein
VAIRQASEWGLYFFAATVAKLLYEQGCSHTSRKNIPTLQTCTHVWSRILVQYAKFVLPSRLAQTVMFQICIRKNSVQDPVTPYDYGHFKQARHCINCRDRNWWQDVDVEVLGCNAVKTCRYQRFGGTLSPSSGLKWNFRYIPMFLRNVGIYQQVYTALQPRTQTSTSSLPWEPQISDSKIINGNYVKRCKEGKAAYLKVPSWHLRKPRKLSR